MRQVSIPKRVLEALNHLAAAKAQLDNLSKFQSLKGFWRL